MATETIEAIYEHRGFQVITPGDLKLIEGQKVRLLIESIKEPEEILALAARVYDGLTNGQEIDAIRANLSGGGVMSSGKGRRHNGTGAGFRKHLAAASFSLRRLKPAATRDIARLSEK